LKVTNYQANKVDKNLTCRPSEDPRIDTGSKTKKLKKATETLSMIS